MQDFQSLLDGKRYVFVPGEDFGPAVGRVVDWVPTVMQPKGGLVPGESPVMNWCNADPNRTDLTHYTIEEGWTALALRLKKFAEVFGVSVDVVQLNHRDAKANLLSKEYVFQIKED